MLDRMAEVRLVFDDMPASRPPLVERLVAPSRSEQRPPLWTETRGGERLHPLFLTCGRVRFSVRPDRRPRRPGSSSWLQPRRPRRHPSRRPRDLSAARSGGLRSPASAHHPLPHPTSVAPASIGDRDPRRNRSAACDSASPAGAATIRCPGRPSRSVSRGVPVPSRPVRLVAATS